MTTKMEHKNILELLSSNEDTGSFEAVIATTGVVDSDGDVIAEGAMAGNTVPILPAHDSSSVPLGKARVEERDDQVVAIGKFNLDIQVARDWFSAIKADLQDPPPKFEYSWGFIPTKFRFEERDDMQVRVIEELDLLEVSPVLRGASVGTRTLSAKQRRDVEDEKNSEDAAESEQTNEDEQKGDDNEQPKVKLVDQVRMAREMAEAAVSRAGEVAQLRAEKRKHLGDEAVKELLQLGSEVEVLVQVCKSVDEILSSPDAVKIDEKARALAEYMSVRARWGR